MKIQINSDNNITGTEGLSARLESEITESLNRFSEQITRIEVHLTEDNKGENDKRCMLEARLKGMQPIAVTNNGETIDNALKGALDKMKALLDTATGRLRKH